LLNVLRCCDEFQVRNIIFSSSCSVYGNINSLPVDENTPLASVQSPYAHTKRMGEEILQEYSQLKKLKAISLRYFNPVGAHLSGMNGENPNQ
jgi:UDP-glucose 4-epimerase